MKISDFFEITTRNNDDWLLIEEGSSGACKKIKVSNLLKNLINGTSGGPDITSYDPDANSVIDSIQSTGLTLTTGQKDACNNRIVAMKNDGVWTKRLAYYGFLGGTSEAHSINWKSPGTQNIIWNGTVTHNSNGIASDGSTGYGNTQIPLSTFNAQNNHCCFYNRSALAPTFGAFLTNQNNALYLENLLFRSAKGASNGGNNSDARSTINLHNGCISASSISTPNISLFKNGSNTTTNRPSGMPENYNFVTALSIFLMAVNANGAAQFFKDAQLASFAIGLGLTDAEVLADYNSEQVYQTALLRQI